MHLDHVSYAAERDGLLATADRLAAALGVTPVDGGYHPRFGTRNVLLPMADGRYVEVVEVLEHPAAEKEPFGRLVRARSAQGGGWLAWVVAVEDIAPVEERLGRACVPGHRRRPDGVELRWRQVGVTGTLADPQLPIVVCWDSPPQCHPSVGASGEVGIDTLHVAGDPDRVRQWLGLDQAYEPRLVGFSFVSPHGTPGLTSVVFSTPAGPIEV